MQRRPLAVLALIEWTRTEPDLDQIRGSQIVITAVACTDDALGPLTDGERPRDPPSGDPPDPALVVDPCKQPPAGSDKGRRFVCQARQCDTRAARSVQLVSGRTPARMNSTGGSGWLCCGRPISPLALGLALLLAVALVRVLGGQSCSIQLVVQRTAYASSVGCRAAMR